MIKAIKFNEVTKKLPKHLRADSITLQQRFELLRFFRGAGNNARAGDIFETNDVDIERTYRCKCNM